MSDPKDFDAYARYCMGDDFVNEMLRETAVSSVADDELDRMTADEARGRFCYLAWLNRREMRRMKLMQNAIHEVSERVLAGMQQHKCDDPACAICEWNRHVTRAASDADPAER